MSNQTSIDQLLAAVGSLGLDDARHSRLTQLIHQSNADAVAAATPPSGTTPSSATSQFITLTDTQLATILASTSPPPKKEGLKLQPLEKFDGSPDQVEPFLASVRRHLHGEPEKHQVWERTLVWILDPFTGNAERWGSANSERVVKGDIPWSDFDSFASDLRRHFGSVGRVLEAQNTIRNIRM